MKKLIVIIIAAFLSFPAAAQNGLFEKLTEKYADQDGFSASQISSEMFDLYLKKRSVDENSSLAEALKELENILVISQSNLNADKQFFGVYRRVPQPLGEEEKEDKKEPAKDHAGDVHKEIISHYKGQGFSLLKTEKRMGEDVKVYLKKEGSKIASLALITNSSLSTNLVELKGNIDLKTVSELSQALNLRGLENLYKIDGSRGASYNYGLQSSRFYMDEARIEEMAARAREMAEEKAALSDEQIAKIEQQAQLQAQKQLEMAQKYRELSEKYGRQPIFLSTPGDTNTVYFIDGKKVKADEIKDLDKGSIKSVEVNKDEKKKKGKTEIRITTK